tara:strand:+ start:184 stop:321 length:138 start_codon:yes stop_codon:yes gene_type:complete
MKCVCKKDIFEHDIVPMPDEGLYGTRYYCDIWDEGFTIADLEEGK